MRSADEVARERAELRKRYESAYDQLAALLFEEDPVGINFGDNSDEYEPEVGGILPRLASCRGLDDIESMVHQEFCAWFGDDTAGPRERYARVASRIHAELADLGGWSS
jgi:hypothetical protein